MKKYHERRRHGDERGNALVEFALILPVFAGITLGIFSGGQAYDRKLTLTNASREASRYGATLPVANFASPFTAPATTSLEAWLDAVADITEQNASGGLASTVAGRSICVAYVYPNGTGTNDRSERLTRTSSDIYLTGINERCFDDGRPPDERRVQVQVARTSSIRAVFYSKVLTLTSESFTRYEAK